MQLFPASAASFIITHNADALVADARSVEALRSVSQLIFNGI
jgi:hypothetical protein